MRPNEPPGSNLRYPAISSIEQVVLLMADGARRTPGVALRAGPDAEHGHRIERAISLTPEKQRRMAAAGAVGLPRQIGPAEALTLQGSGRRLPIGAGALELRRGWAGLAPCGARQPTWSRLTRLVPTCRS